MAPVVVVLVGLVALGLVLFALATSLQHVQEEQTGKAARAAAVMAAANLDKSMAERSADVITLTQNVRADQVWERPDRLRGWVDSLSANSTGFSWVGFASIDGVIGVGSGRLAEGAGVNGRPWFEGARDRLFFGDVREAQVLAKVLPPLPDGEQWRFVDISAPVRDKQGVFRGVVAAHLSWPWLRSQLDSVKPSLPLRAQVVLLGPDDRARTGSGQSEAPLLLESVRLARAGQVGWVVEQWPDGHRYLTGYSPNTGYGAFPGFGWLTLVRVPADTWSATMVMQLKYFAAAGVVLVLLLGGVAWFSTRVWLRPLASFSFRLSVWRKGQEAPPLHPSLPREFHQLNEGISSVLASINAERVEALHERDGFRGALELIGRHLPGVVGTFRHDGVAPSFSFVSKSVARYFGVDQATLLADSQAWARHADPDDVHELRTRFAEMNESGRASLSMILRLKGSDGVLRSMQTVILRRDGEAEQVFDWVALDVTDLLVAREVAEAANRSKTEFLATMSHEVRTPLTAILGFSRVLEDTLTDEVHKRHAHFIRETGEVLTRVLNDVLDLTRIDAGRLSLAPRPFTLDQVLEGCKAIYRVVAAQKGVGLHIESPRDLPRLYGDPVRLRQIVENLLSNALKFTAEGAVQVRIQVLRREVDVRGANKLWLTIHVVDTGIGIPPAQRGRIFERFTQADSLIKTKYGGAGLGLAIVKALVDTMGGSIHLSSQVGVGSEFTVHLPFDLWPEDAPCPELLAAESKLRDREPQLLVLVADDIVLNRLVIRTLLEERGHQVIEACDGVEALHQIRTFQPDLALMDLDMPTMDGLAATERLRQSEGPGRDTPIYALTGRAFADDFRAAVGSGMNGHLSKPLDMDEFVRILRSVTPMQRTAPPTAPH